MASEKLDTRMKELPICPYCENEERDAWEINFGPGLDGDAHHSCGSCGCEYFVERSVSVYYTTSIVD